MDVQTADKLRTDLAQFICEEVAGDNWDEQSAFHDRKAAFYRRRADDVIAMVAEAQRPADHGEAAA